MTEFAIEPYAADAPLHVVGAAHRRGEVRDLLALAGEGIAPLSRGREARAVRLPHAQRAPGAGQQRAGRAALRSAALDAELQRAFADGAARAAAPPPARRARARASPTTSRSPRHAARSAAARRKVRSERELGPARRPHAGCQPPPARHAQTLHRSRDADDRAGGVERLHRHVGLAAGRRDRRLKARAGRAGDRRERCPARRPRAPARRPLRWRRSSSPTPPSCPRRRAVRRPRARPAPVPLHGAR